MKFHVWKMLKYESYSCKIRTSLILITLKTFIINPQNNIFLITL